MDKETCIKKLGLVGVLNFATVEKNGCSQEAIDEGSPSHIRPENCLHYGRCY